MQTLFDVNHAMAGFRLQFLEIYNWGTFDQKIWRLAPDGQHSLLTGANGSGKTTIVDALLTLLVPASRRFYNQSSGANNRRERDEKSYCLGAYGNIQFEQKGAATTQYLRTKDDYSILLACFRDDRLEQDVTLAQVRWFANHDLKRAYILSPQQLTIKTHLTPLDPAGEWKRRLRAYERTEIFDTFTQYSQRSAKIFGFKSEKALTLFAHIVGIKVLGNLNEFIRANMLEEQDIDDEFKKLREHYDNLLSVHNTIEKAQAQLGYLEPLIAQGEEYQAVASALNEVEETLELVPAYFAQQRLDLLTQAQQRKAQQLAQLENQLASARAEWQRCDSEKTDLEIAISKDETGEQIRNLEREKQTVAKERDARQRKAREYTALCEMLELPLHPDDATFYETMRRAKIRKQDIEHQLPDLHEQWSDYRALLQAHKKESQELFDEIRSLEGRQNQIPLKNISIRKGILAQIQASEAELPFIGELMQVKPAEKDWETAIERVLHNFGLILLVPHRYYRQVNKYVNTTDLMGRLVYYRVEPEQADTSEYDEHPASLLNKLELHPYSEYRHWLRGQLRRSYNYICAEHLDDFQRYEKALTKEGLVKNFDRHEKDDRMQGARQSNHVLGWDNSTKVHLIQTQRRELENTLDRVNGKLKEVERLREDLSAQRDLIARLLSFADYAEIDWQPDTLKIQQLGDEEQRLKESSDQLRELERQLHQVKTEIQQNKQAEDRLGEQRVHLKRDMQEYAQQQAQDCAALTAYAQARRDACFPQIEPYVAALNLTLSLENLAAAAASTRDSIYRVLRERRQQLSRVEIDLVRLMHTFKTPPEAVTQRYPSWTADTLDLHDAPEAFRDYGQLYQRIKNEDLPRHEERFKTWLNERVIVNFASFETSLDKQFKAIKANLKELNDSLKQIEFHTTPPTYIQIDAKELRDHGDAGIAQFRQSLREVFANVSQIYDPPELEISFRKVKTIIERLTSDESWRRKVTDVRNWLEFGALENHRFDDSPKRYYDDSQGLSGGEKAKLAYTILASAIAYQFGIHQQNYQTKSFRFVVVDEAFSKVDPENALFAMELFQQLHLQIMVVTPLDKINIVEKFIHAVHYTENKNRQHSAVYDLTIEEYHARKDALKAS